MTLKPTLYLFHPLHFTVESALLMFGFVPSIFSQQNFYDIHTIQKINLIFSQPDWDYRLDTLKKGGGGYLMAQSVIINDVQYDSVGVKYKGNSSYDSTYKKNPFNISLDEYKKQNYQGFKTIKLANCFSDPSMIREVLSYSIVGKYMDAPRANYAKVYINGEYIGLYANTETINKQFCSDHFYSSKNTFVSCSPAVIPTPQIKSNLRYLGADTTLYYSNYEIKSSYGWEDLANLCDSLTNSPSSFEKVVDADRVLWMLALNTAFLNLDSYSGVFCQNYYLYKDATGRFNPIMWDFNMSFGGFPFAGSSNTSMGAQTLQTLSQLSPEIHAKDKYWPLINIVMNNAGYRWQFYAHLRTILRDDIVSKNYLDEANALRNQIRESVKEDNNKFFSNEQFEQSLSDNINIGAYQIPGIETIMTARANYLSNIEEIKVAQPEIQHSMPRPVEKGKMIALTVVSNTTDVEIYAGTRFAKDGKFKRVQMLDDGEHGDGSAGDGIYGCTFEMKDDELQYYFYAENDKAGVFLPERAEHEYFTITAQSSQIKTGEIVINEFLASNATGAVNEKGKHEDWIEFYNTTDRAIDLFGLYLTDKFSTPQKFVFPTNSIILPKSFLTVWADEDSTTKQYIHVNFKLSSNGEQLMLSTADGITLDSITFGEQTADVSLGRCADGVGMFKSLGNPTFNAPNDCIANSVSDLYLTDNVEVTPNPAENDVCMRSSNPCETPYSLVNIFGETVMSGLFTGSNQIIVRNLSSGAYILVIGKQRVQLLITH